MVGSGHHIMSTMIHDPESRFHHPSLIAGEVGKCSLPMCPGQRIGQEHKQPVSGPPLGARHWQLVSPPMSDGRYVFSLSSDCLGTDALMPRKPWNSDTKGGTDLDHEFATSSCCVFTSAWISIGICHPSPPCHCHPNLSFPSSGKWNAEYLCLPPQQIAEKKRILL